MYLISSKCLLICSLLIILTTAACSTKSEGTVNLEEYAFNDAVETCKSAADEMTDGAKGSSNPMWNSYFEMCMSSKGYEPKEYEDLWY